MQVFRTLRPLAAASIAGSLAASGWVSGCGSEAPLPESPPAPLAPLERLELDTGVDWALLIDPDRTVFLAPVDSEAPRLGPGDSPEAIAFDFLRAYGDVLGIGDPDAELVPVGVDRDPAGPRVYFLQVSGDLLVEGAMLLVHFDAAGGVQSVNGRYVPAVAGVDRNPSLQADEALAAVEAELSALEPGFDPSWLDPPPEVGLVIGADAHEPPRLAYGVEVTLKQGRQLAFVVDANDGRAYVARDSEVHATVPGSGHGVWGEADVKSFPVTAAGDALYELRQPAGAAMPGACNASIAPPEIAIYRAQFDNDVDGVIVSSSDPSSWEASAPPSDSGMAVDAYAHLRMTETYFRERHCRWSHDGVGGPVTAVVAAPLSTMNHWGLWDGSLRKLAFWGGGAYSIGDVKAASGALDVVAHEYTHAILSAVRKCETLPWTSGQWGLLLHAARCSDGPSTRGQAGALGEALGDVFGNLAERYQSVDDANNLLFGERAYCPGNPIDGGAGCAAGERDAARDLVDPRRFGAADHMHRYASPGQEHVHDNSGIVAKAFSMMTVGGTNEVSKITVPAADAIGWAKAEWLWYKALSSLYLRSSFSAFANQTIKLAPQGGVAREPVACAWVAVGVLYGDQVERMWGVQCPESAAHDDLLGHWDWTHGNWGTMSFAAAGTLLKEDGTSEKLVRGVYTYREGTTLVSCDEHLRKCEGVWWEGSRDCQTYGDHGRAEFQLLSNGTINGRWTHLDDAVWGENWDLARSLHGDIPPEDLIGLQEDSAFQCP